MSIRIATEKDVPAVTTLALESLEYGPYKGIVQRNPEYAGKLVAQLVSDANGCIVVSEHKETLDGLFGFIVFPHFYSGEMTAGELIWYTSPEARLMHGFGDSVAFDLLQAGERKAAEMGAKVMQLGAPSEAIGKLYQRRGYSQVEVTYRRELACQLQRA